MIEWALAHPNLAYPICLGTVFAYIVLDCAVIPFCKGFIGEIRRRKP